MSFGLIGKRRIKGRGRSGSPVSRLRMCTELYPPSITSVPWTLETSFEDRISAGVDTEAKKLLADFGMFAVKRGLGDGGDVK